MPARLIKQFSDASTLEYATGRFDGWCIFHACFKQKPTALKDNDIFTDIVQLGLAIGSIKLYQNFLQIYDLTTSVLSPQTLKKITTLAQKHPGYEDKFDFQMTFLYAGMVAEENRKGTILRRRIKRLGIHQLLVEDRPPSYAANFSRGKGWKELDTECRVRGF